MIILKTELFRQLHSDGEEGFADRIERWFEGKKFESLPSVNMACDTKGGAVVLYTWFEKVEDESQE